MMIHETANEVRTSPWSRSIQGAFLVAVFSTIGCGTSTEGGPEDARAHLTSEFDKWVGGLPNAVGTLEAGARGVQPTSYAIESLVRGERHILATLKEPDTPSDEFKTYPSYRANVALTFKSVAGTPTSRIASYGVTWSEKHKVWYVIEAL